MTPKRHLFVLLLATLICSCKTQEKPAATNPTTPAPAPAKQTMRTQAATLYPIINEANLWGFMDEHGQIAIEPVYGFVDLFTEGKARVKRGDQWGFIDINGKEVVEPKYERARRFADGLAAVRVNRKYGYIDHSGTMVIPPQYSKMAQAFSHGLAAVPDSAKKYGFVDRTGKIVIPHRFDEAHAFSEGVAAVEENNKWGFIDTTGNWVLAPQFIWADQFVDGYSLVRIGTQPHVDYALIDRKGNIQFRLQTLHAETPAEGLIRFELNGKWGFADRTGKFVIPPKYEAAFDFSEGFAAVRIGNGWGYIDTGDKLAINLNYNVAEAFRNGVARVSWPGGKWGYIDRTGRTIWESKTATGIAAPSGDTDS